MLPVALTIAGSDSSGGAGVQADLRTFAALQVFGTSALTAITAQNTRGVDAVERVSPAMVSAQIHAVVSDLAPVAIKTGMLVDAEVIAAVVAALKNVAVDVIVDPVMIAKSGHALLRDDAVEALRTLLIPCAALITPNAPEAARLVGFDVQNADDQERAGRALLQMGARAALVKGGHLAGDPVDVLVTSDFVKRFSAPRIHTRHTHGTGCTLSAAIAAYLARGTSLVDAVTHAHTYVLEALRTAPGLGHGHGPLHHMHPWYPS